MSIGPPAKNGARASAMTKKQLIEYIMRLNRSATAEFLEDFEENELDQYLQRLIRLRDERGGQLLQEELTI
jgi:hypothetical protein